MCVCSTSLFSVSFFLFLSLCLFFIFSSFFLAFFLEFHQTVALIRFFFARKIWGRLTTVKSTSVRKDGEERESVILSHTMLRFLWEWGMQVSRFHVRTSLSRNISFTSKLHTRSYYPALSLLSFCSLSSRSCRALLVVRHIRASRRKGWRHWLNYWAIGPLCRWNRAYANYSGMKCTNASGTLDSIGARNVLLTYCDPSSLLWRYKLFCITNKQDIYCCKGQCFFFIKITIFET